MLDVRVTGAQELDALARRLREADQRHLLPQMRRAFERATRPVEPAVRATLPVYLPNRYAAILAKAMKVAVRMKTAGRDVSVRLVLTAKGKAHPRKVAPLDNPGLLRAPSFPRGRRSTWRWHEQHVRPGFWSDHVERLRGDLRKASREAMHTTAEKITKG